jgi:hypothetical protein
MNENTIKILEIPNLGLALYISKYPQLIYSENEYSEVTGALYYKLFTANIKSPNLKHHYSINTLIRVVLEKEEQKATVESIWLRFFNVLFNKIYSKEIDLEIPMKDFIIDKIVKVITNK